jgi:hypothetical protein
MSDPFVGNNRARGMGSSAFRWFGSVVLCLLALSAARAGDSFLEGTYLRGKVCTGHDQDVEPLRVKITPSEIIYRGGTCTIDQRSGAETSVTMRVSCHFHNGLVLASDISFTKRDDNTIDMAQKDGSYNAVLNRCPVAP